MVALVPGAAEHDRLKQFLGVLYPFDRGLVNAVLEMQRYIGGQKDILGSSLEESGAPTHPPGGLTLLVRAPRGDRR